MRQADTVRKEDVEQMDRVRELVRERLAKNAPAKKKRKRIK